MRRWLPGGISVGFFCFISLFIVLKLGGVHLFWSEQCVFLIFVTFKPVAHRGTYVWVDGKTETFTLRGRSQGQRFICT
jgi:hypothetical protein